MEEGNEAGLLILPQMLKKDRSKGWEPGRTKQVATVDYH
jgi:hypothetical protein